VITELGKGEALVSFLEGNGTPSVVERCMILPPSARVGPLTPEERQALIAKSPMRGKYDKTIDPESAFEMLQKRVVTQTEQAQAPEASSGGILDMIASVFGMNSPRGKTLTAGQRVTREVTRTVANQVAGNIAAQVGKSVAGSIGGSVGRAIVRGALGGILRR
jgi:hypothetical protein